MTTKRQLTEQEGQEFIDRCRQLTPISCMHLVLYACDVLQQTHGCDEDALNEARRLISKEVLEDMPTRRG